jgi:hypothetical protein
MRATTTECEKSGVGFIRGLGLLDSTMIGSGIFIFLANIARQTGSAGGLFLSPVRFGLFSETLWSKTRQFYCGNLSRLLFFKQEKIKGFRSRSFLKSLRFGRGAV